jgi:tRNA (guanine6-N2)-methyltransferase
MAIGRSAAPGARELGRRNVPERAGITVFTAPRPEALRSLRTSEDLFAVVGYRHGLASDPSALERIAAIARGAPYVEQALAARTRLMPRARSGRRLHYRVIARMAGEHQFRRVDLARAVSRGIAERADHSWRLSPDRADVEFWATMLPGELILAIRLSDEHMRHRDYKAVHLPGSLRPAVAAALALLSKPMPEDVVLDPLCGAATILIERAHLGRYRLLMGCDRDARALSAARENLGPRYKPLELHRWDATALPLPDRSVAKIITNLPWGIRHGSHEDNRRLYPRILEEFHRLLQPGGKMVILTGETRLMSDLIVRGLLRPDQILRVSILGASAAVYVSSAPH